MKQVAWRRLKNAWDAVVGTAELVVAAENVPVKSVVHETAKKQIQPTVVVVVEPDGAGRPTPSLDARFGAYVSEGPVSVVTIQDGRMIICGDQQIAVTIV